MERVTPLVDKEKLRLRFLIEWDQEHFSVVSYRRVETRWSDGTMVTVKPGSEHARICRQILRDQGYSTRRR